MIKEDIKNELDSAKAFSKQSAVFDDIYIPDKIIQYKRERVRTHFMKYLKPGSHILELNAGTGEDAIFLANSGHFVHATDISEGMQDQLAKKVKKNGLEDKITYELCSFTKLDELKDRGPYDAIFSNFAGLNCTGELEKVLQELPQLLKPGGVVTLVLLPGFCLWEFLLMFRGKFKTATRRFFSSKGAPAYIDGVNFKCWYYNPSFVIDETRGVLEPLAVEGLCTIVPPSYIEGFADKHPKLYKRFQKLENKLKSKWPWRSIGDYYIISLYKC